jgi:hypothetical protein
MASKFLTRITSNLPAGDELRLIRTKSAVLAKTLGYNAVAKSIRAGGPLEANLDFVYKTLSGRQYSQARMRRPLTDAEVRINQKVAAIKDGVGSLILRVRQLGGR